MNSKITTNLQLSTTEPKKNKKTQQTTRIRTESRNGDHMEGYQRGGGEWGNSYKE